MDKKYRCSLSGYNKWIVQIILFYFFFVMSFGFGYSTLNRYDPRQTGVSDSASYYEMTLNRHQNASPKHRYRVLTPFFASKILWLTSKLNLRTWDKVFFSLLIVNSAFTSGAALVLIKISETLKFCSHIGILSAVLFLCSFIVPNCHLAGMVDAGEAFFFFSLILATLKNKLFWLPFIMIPGGLAKETVVIFGFAYLLGWSISYGYFTSVLKRYKEIIIIFGSVVIGMPSVLASRLIVGGEPYPLPGFSLVTLIEFIPGFFKCILNQTFLITFCYLLPMGIFRLKELPNHMLWGLLSAAIVATGSFIYASRGGEWANASRPIFNVSVPVLAISSAIFISDITGGCKARD